MIFDGLKVLDVGSWIAAPVAATMLADYGAQVIKIEAPGDGDGYRKFSDTAGAADAPLNYAWQMDARNKRSISLNLLDPRGRQILGQLAATADVYITNHTPAMRDRFSTHYADFKADNPGLIYASLTAYGEQGPERNREGFDLVAYWSRSGLMDLVRAPGADPSPAVPGMGDHPTAVAMYANVVTALLHRERTGEGSYVHTSLLANGIWSASCIAQAAFAEGSFARYRDDHKNLFTRVLYEAADGRWLQFTMVRTEQQVAAMLSVLGLAELLLDERFADMQSAVAHGAELVSLLRPAIAQRTSAEWMKELQAAEVPVALVAQVEDLPEDPQVLANNMFVDPGTTGLSRLLKHPLNIDSLTRVEPSQAPDAGEHSTAVLQELGLSAQDIEQLRQDGVI